MQERNEKIAIGRSMCRIFVVKMHFEMTLPLS